MRIDFWCESGSPIGVVPRDIETRGVGGAELALLSLSEALATRGHSVTVYNNPREAVNSIVMFEHHKDFCIGQPTDAFVLFRNPSPKLYGKRAEHKIFWSCDQFTSGNYAQDIFPFVDNTVTISPHHRDYHVKNWKADPARIGYIDLGVRLWEYKGAPVERVPGRLIFCSVPTRGLEILAEVWDRIKARVASANLVITGDFTLWGAEMADSHKFRLMFAGDSFVQYFGKVPRSKLVELQLSSQLLAYPCIYEELFCISAAECQVAGAIPITSTFGALSTTNAWGLQLEGDPRTKPWMDKFVGIVCSYLLTGTNHIREKSMVESRKRFDWNLIAQQWEQLIETGRFPT